MGQCLSAEMMEELVGRLYIEGEELEQAAESLNIDFQTRGDERNRDINALIEFSMDTNATSFEAYRADVAEIANELEIDPETAYEAVAIAWTAGQQEVDRGIAEMREEGIDITDGMHPCDTLGIPLPLVALQRTGEFNAVAIGD